MITLKQLCWNENCKKDINHHEFYIRILCNCAQIENYSFYCETLNQLQANLLFIKDIYYIYMGNWENVKA